MTTIQTAPCTEAPMAAEQFEQQVASWETPCPEAASGLHCRHWYDAEACCRCGDPEDACQGCGSYGCDGSAGCAAQAPPGRTA